ncbi:MAG: hypothetical protein JWP61_144, partial [Friedmanniella sp.]|nr:hypothetical protein [Friedmanniella sp.]
MSRRERRTRTSRVVRRSIAGLALLIVVLVLLAAWQLAQAAREVSQAKAEASSMRASLSARDFVAARRDAESLGSTAAGLKSRTDGMTWSAMSALPFVGSDLEAVSTASRGLYDVAQGALQVTSVLAKPHGLLRGDRVSISAVRTIAAATDTAARGLEDLGNAVSVLQDSRLSPVRSRAAELGNQVDTGKDGVKKFQPLVHHAPEVLGAGGTRHYLLVFQNNAEVRATGGLLGSAARVTVDHGRLQLGQTFSPVLKTDQTKPDFGFTASERTLYGRDLDRGAVFLNSMPDFPRTANLLRRGWSSWFGGRLDGVIAVDTVSIGYLLDATGPLNVMDQELNSGNAVETLLSRAYSLYPDNKRQDEFFSAVAGQLFATATGGKVAGPDLVAALRRMSQESRLGVHFFAPQFGALNLDPFQGDAGATQSVTVGFNNVSGDKMSYYLRRRVSVTSISCVDGRQQLRGLMRISSQAPVGAAGLPQRVTDARPNGRLGGAWNPVRLGGQLVQVVLRAPVGGRIGPVRLDGELVHAERV